jgi:FkbM family methyltransferase
MLPRWLKNGLKRSPRLVKANRAFRWQIHRSKDWWNTKIWRSTRAAVTPFGFKFTAGAHPAYEQMRQGIFEPEETQIIQERIRRADLFVDIGANLGYYSCMALQAGRKVIAFEPQPQNLAILYTNLIDNGWDDRAEVMPVALGGKPGLLTLYGASGPSASLVPNWAGYSSRYRQIVAVSTLDAILAGRFANQRLFLKIDVEGAEHMVLQGAPETLARTPRPSWLLEVCLQEFHPEGANPHFGEIFELFFSHGYAAYTANAERRQVTREDVARWVEKRASDSGTFNYLFADPVDLG